MKISEAFELYETRLNITGNSLNTVEQYKYACKSIIGIIGDCEIESVCEKQINYLAGRLAATVSVGTMRAYLSCFRSVLRVCQRTGLNVMCPEDIMLPKKVKRQAAYLTKSEVDEFIKIAATHSRGYPEINRVRNVTFITLLFQTGLRISELCALDRNTIKNRQFSVVGKSKEPRVCFITREMEDMIKHYLSLRKDKNKALFYCSQTGTRLTPKNARCVFKRICDISDFELVHPHTMRHSCATYLLEQGVEIRDISELLGHQSLDTTKIYTHVANPRLKNIYERAMV